MRNISRVVFACLFLFCARSAFARVEVGQGIFFDHALAEKIETYASFPLTWWGFFTFDAKSDADLRELRTTCARLRAEGKAYFAILSCGDEIETYEPLLRDWARDVVFREPMPTEAGLRERLGAALARASLPLPSAVLSLTRYDPLGTYRDLKAILEKRSPIQLPRREGVFWDEAARRALIPVKMAFPPGETMKTAAALALFHGDSRWGALGAHFATLGNQTRIQDDMGRVSAVGLGLLALGLGLLALLGRGRLLLIAPIVGIAVGAAALFTSLVFGGIHGLTLSFGSAIIGLALDYGFHGALNSRPYVARSNLFGFLTTIGVLVVLMFSQIPLLRQMMVFSTVGISLAFVGMHLFGVRGVPGFAIRPRAARWKALVTIVLAIGAVVGLRITPSFDLARFNFQNDRDKELTLWLAKRANLMPPLFTIDDELHSDLMPPAEAQVGNLATWANFDAVASRLPENERRFFAPFIEGVRTAPARETLPAYLADYEARGKYLTLYLPKTPDEMAAIKLAHPTATSLREVVEVFPQTLAAELKWMIPAALAVVFALLLFYYRDVRIAWLPLLPLFTGVGLGAWCAILLHLPVSFVTLIGVVMLCGLSVDYGIFATDAAIAGGDGAWTAILIASLATLGGFLPLVFCRHQVLAQLGAVLSVGTFGTIIGAFWGIPSLRRA